MSEPVIKKPSHEQFIAEAKAIYQKFSAHPFLARKLPPYKEFLSQTEETWKRVEPMSQDEFEVYCKASHISSVEVLRSLEKGIKTAIENRDTYLASLSWIQKRRVWLGTLYIRIQTVARRFFARY